METRSEIRPVKLANGMIIHVEVATLGGEEDIANKLLAFGDVSAVIEGISTEILGAMAKAKPSKATAEFGLEVAVDSGNLTALLVKGSGKATLKVTLEWHRD